MNILSTISTKENTVRTGKSSITQQFSAKQLQELALEELPNIPQPFIVEKHKKLPKGISALLMNEASFMSPPVSIDVPEEVHQQRHTRGLYSPTKFQESSADRVSPIHKSRGDRKIVRNPLKNYFVRRKQSGFLLLMLLNNMGMVQALTDCQIMKDWLPTMLSGADTSCCSQVEITCAWGVRGRITQMYAIY
jgi:hypothetical protein